MQIVDQSSLGRLRASRDAVTTTRRVEGIILGRTWALNGAEFGELARVATLSKYSGVVTEVAYALAAAVLEQDRPRTCECEELFEHLFGCSEPGNDMAAGFIEGAVEVSRQI